MVATTKWDSSVEVGIDIIDDQHKILFDLAKDLDNAVNTGASMNVVDTLFSVIEDFAFKHFETEEGFLKDENSYLKHCHIHYQLLKKFHDYKVDFHNGRTDGITPGIFLKEWILTHIKEDDIPALSQKVPSQDLVLEIDAFDDFDAGDIDRRIFKRLRYDKVLNEEISGHCFNATKMKNGPVNVIDLSSGGLKIYSENKHDIDDLLIISCDIGRNFKLRQKVKVKNINDCFLGVEFISPDEETVSFLTQLLGAVNYSRS